MKSDVRWILATLALSMLLSSLGVSIPNVALPRIAEVFSASFSGVQWIILIYLLTMTVLIVSVGRLADILGHRRILLIGIFLFTGASLLCGLAPTLTILIIGRAFQGLGGAVLISLTIALVGDTVPKEKIGSAMGLLGTVSAIGTAVGPSLGGLLISTLGWRAIFLLMIPLGVLNFFLARYYLPVSEKSWSSPFANFDGRGTALFTLTLVAYTLGATVGGGHFDQINAILLLASVVAGYSFVRMSAKVSSPLIRWDVLRSSALAPNLAMNVIVATVMMSTLVVGPFYLSRVLGLKEVHTGLVMASGPLIAVLTGVPAGRIVDRWGASLTVILGLIEMVIGSASLSVLPTFFGVIGYIISIAILTPGYQLFQAANNTVVMRNVPQSQRGVVSGLLSLSRNLGLITGTAIMGGIFSMSSGTGQFATANPDAIAFGQQTTFFVATILMVGALGIAAKFKSQMDNN